MAAGTALPTHFHADTEECSVVEGDLRDRDLQLHGWDYIRFEGGTSHTVSTDGGCLLLVRSSLYDSAVEASPA